jgi:hypothetical protein
MLRHTKQQGGKEMNNGSDFVIGFFISTVIFSLFFFGDNRVSAAHLNRAHSMCTPNGGVRYIDGHGFMSTLRKTVKCKNGAEFEMLHGLISNKEERK